MDIIKTGVTVTKALRNMGRLREIVIVLVKHGLGEFVSLETLSDILAKIPGLVLPKSRKRGVGALGKRLRQCCEELGPSFVKFGQLLSTREDIFEESFTRELAKLRERVRPIALAEVREAMEESLGRPLEEIFSSLEEEPLGTASIGSVYRGVLKNGDTVVVKVKRPGIDRIIETDFSIILFLIQRLEKVSEEMRYLGLSRIVEDFSESIHRELNFHIEKANSKRFRDNIKAHPGGESILIPKVYGEYSTDKILTMEYIEGPSLNTLAASGQGSKEVRALLDVGLGLFLGTFLRDGFFHADLHGGNIIFSEGKLGIIDYGLMGTLTKSNRHSLVIIVYALAHGKFDALVHEFLDIAEYEDIPDVEALTDDVRRALSPILSLSTQEIDYTSLFKHSVACLKRHRVFLPGEWFIVFRSLVALDGLGRSLNYGVNIFERLEGNMEDFLLSCLSKEELLEDALWTGRDMLSAARSLPRHLKWFIRRWAKNGHILEIKHEHLGRHVQTLVHGLRFLGAIFLAGVFTLCGVLLFLESSLPLAWTFWFLALVSLVGGGFSTRGAKF